MIRPLLLLAAYLALASAQCTEQAKQVQVFDKFTGLPMNNAFLTTLLCANDTHIDGHETHDASGNPVDSRRLYTTTQSSNIRADGLLMFNGGIGDGLPTQTMTAKECFFLCQRTNAPTFTLAETNWQMGVVRNHAERDHIATVINNFYLSRTAHLLTGPYVFWPDTQSEVDAVKKANGDKIPDDHSIWIGHYGDAGQTNATLPFIDSDEYGGQMWSTWEPKPSDPFGYRQKMNPLGSPPVPVYPYTSGSTVKSAATPYAWYPWRPFANTEWIDPSFTDFAPAIGSTPAQPTSDPVQTSPTSGLWMPKACVKMAYSWNNVEDANVNTNGKWRNAPCTAADNLPGDSLISPVTYYPDAKAKVCFCRAVCSVDAAQVCLAKRRCSADGTSIMNNYEFDYVSCDCKPIEPERCCTKCSDKADPYLTGGRLVPTECRGLVPGDPQYEEQTYTAASVNELVKINGNFIEGYSAYPVDLPNEKPFKACRRILFGDPKKPIFLGDGRNTMADDNAQGPRLGVRRDLPSQ